MTERAFTVVASGMGFAEGPVFRQDGDIVVTSLDRGHLYRLASDGAHLFAAVGGGPNGATEARDGRLYVTQCPWRRSGALTGGIQVVHTDRRVEWVTTDPLTPNDLCFGPDDRLWVTDPSRGRWNDGRLWRVDVETRDCELLTSTDYFPNGIGFGVEQDALFVADTGGKRILRYPLGSFSIGKAEVAVQMDHGHPDGFAFDTEGHIVIGANGAEGAIGDLQVWDVNGKLLEVIRPERGRWLTNVAISKDKRLIATNPPSASRVIPAKWEPDEGHVIEAKWPYPGLPLYPFR